MFMWKKIKWSEKIKSILIKIDLWLFIYKQNNKALALFNLI